MANEWQAVDDEAIKVGDLIKSVGRVVRIRPYTGPLIDIVFAIAECDTGRGISLQRGGTMNDVVTA